MDKIAAGLVHQSADVTTYCAGVASTNPTTRKSGCGPGLRELPEISSFPLNISATVEASDFKFSMQLKFAKAHHKITPRKK